MVLGMLHVAVDKAHVFNVHNLQSLMHLTTIFVNQNGYTVFCQNLKFYLFKEGIHNVIMVSLV